VPLDIHGAVWLRRSSTFFNEKRERDRGRGECPHRGKHYSIRLNGEGSPGVSGDQEIIERELRQEWGGGEAKGAEGESNCQQSSPALKKRTCPGFSGISERKGKEYKRRPKGGNF